uniref:Alanine--glyoxylate aminotransferase n=1 Tax=Globodera pallida TaxID=36090 RepID=A0A183BM69_GLOPA
MLSRMFSPAGAVTRMCEHNKRLLRKRVSIAGLLTRCMANSSFSATVAPPHRLLRPMHINEKKLFGPGPSNMPPLVQEGLMQPLLGHMHPEFFEIMDDVKAGIQYIFQTENALTFAVSGTGHAGMECAILNLLEPGETILVVQNGVWGQRAASLSERLGLKVHRLIVPEGEVINLEDFAEAVDNYRPQVAFVCHGESSTGVVHPLERFGDICKAFDVLFLVDTVASIGGAPFHADALKVDCVYAATQKVLNCPPGEKITNRKTRVPSFYFDALELGNYWGCFNEPRRYHHTAPISLVYALREGLSAVAQEGIGHMINRHKINAKLFYAALKELRLELFVEKENNRLPCLTTVRVPDGVDWKAVQDKLMAQGFEIAGGLGPTAGKIWRIGTFGINSNPEDIESLKQALKGALYEDEEETLDHFKAAI